MEREHFDVLVIGCGISGIAAAYVLFEHSFKPHKKITRTPTLERRYYLRKNNPDKSFRILERRESLGGTWDFFKYPGIRSDSDMYTFGYSFRPWTARKMIAPKEDILTYLWNVVHEFDLEKHIRFNMEVSDATFSSDRGTWYVDCKNGKRYSCSFLFMCTGYYKYDKGYTPDFEGMSTFRGRVVHPQAWDLETSDYEGKRIVVIGSGATAATLIPALAEKAKFVTMLQRSPGYYAARPSETSGVSKFLNGISPYLGHWLNRWKNIAMGSFLWYMSKKYPKTVRGYLLNTLEQKVHTSLNNRYEKRS